MEEITSTTQTKCPHCSKTIRETVKTHRVPEKFLNVVKQFLDKT